MKFHLTTEGFLCECFPNFPVTEDCAEIELTEEQKEKVSVGKRGYAWKYIDGELVLTDIRNDVDYRRLRLPLLAAFDKWEKAVLRGRESEDKKVMNWYQELLDLAPTAFEEGNIPDRIKYYF